MSDAAPVLALRGVGKRYGEVTAVHAVDLDLREGEFVSFLGPSGSGKTTTLMMVAGLQQPSAGTILLNGQDIGREPPYRRNLGMVFQHYALFPHLSVARNVAFPLEMRHVPRADIRRRVTEALRLVGLPDHAARMPAQLSGGQQQRVALARALVYRPPLMLLDEPLGALDKHLREQMQLEISRLHRELGMAMLYVTHDQEEALVMSDRIAVFNLGRIEQIGTPEDLYERPASRFVAGFLGDSSFLPGRLRGIEGGLAAIETAHGRFLGRPAPGLVAGGAALLAVRPEHVAVLAAGAAMEAGGGDGELPGRVADLAYHGRARKLMITLGDGTEMLALTPVTRSFDRGQAVRLRLPPEACTVLPDR